MEISDESKDIIENKIINKRDEIFDQCKAIKKDKLLSRDEAEKKITEILSNLKKDFSWLELERKEITQLKKEDLIYSDIEFTPRAHRLILAMIDKKIYPLIKKITSA